MTTTTSDLTRVLDAQHEDLRAILALSTRQGQCLAREDLAGVETVSARMHALMRRIQLRQSELPGDLARTPDPAVAERVRDMQDTLQRAMRMRQTNEHSACQLLARTRSELKHLRQGEQATRGYRHLQVADSRFYDGRR